MTTTVFCCLPAHGHLNPTLAVARELVARGEHVIYYLPESFRVTIEATGATLRIYEMNFDEEMNQLARATQPEKMFVQVLSRILDMGRDLLPQVLEWLKIDGADCIVYESLCIWGNMAAKILALPAVHFSAIYLMSAHSGVSYSDELRVIGKKLHDLGMSYGVPMEAMDFFNKVEPLSLVFHPRAFYPDNLLFDERLLFVGPSITPHHDTSDFPVQKLDQHPLLYISMGTVFSDRADFFHLCFDTFKDSPWYVVLAHWTHVERETLASIPQNFLVAPSVPQLEVLARAQVFVTHGGISSIMESLFYGVPMVVIPQMSEQAIAAQRIQKLGLGVVLDPNQLSVDELQAAVARVAEDPSFRERAQDMQQMIQEAGGYQRAADAIIQYTRPYIVR